MNRIGAELRPAVMLLVVFTVLLGGVYPLVMLGIGQLAFSGKANGSMVARGGEPVGSALIAQGFAKQEYFHARPSANAYDAANSGASNLGPTSKAWVEQVVARALALSKENPGQPVPSEMVMASGSGLDPHISPEAARFQLPRVAKARGVEVGALEALIASHTEGKLLGVFGQPRVNVLQLNLALDADFPVQVAKPTKKNP